MTTTTLMPEPTVGEFGGKPLYGQRFKVTSVTFDWEVDEEDAIPSEEKKQAIINGVLDGEWIVVTTDDDWDEETYATELVDQISDETGWLIEDIDYLFITPN
jgi:hypothetical protein